MTDAEKGAHQAAGHATDASTAGRTWPQGGHSIHQLGRPDITEIELGKKTHKVAAVEPMDLDGVATMAVGTMIWTFAAIVLLVMRDELSDSGHTWWIGVAITGAVLGVVGVFYCRRRKIALASQAVQSSDASATGATVVSPADASLDS